VLLDCIRCIALMWHIATHVVCYTVCVSLCLAHRGNCAEMTKPIEMPSRWQTYVCPRNDVLDGVQIMRCGLKLHTHTHTRLTAVCPGLPGWASTRKGKPIWILLKQETVSSSGISWAICKSAPRPRQITMPAPHHSVFYRPYALPASQPTVSEYWRQMA